MDAHTIKKALVNYRKNVDAIQRLSWKLEEISTKHYEGGTASVIKLPEREPPDRSKIISDFLVKVEEINSEIEQLSKEVQIADEFIEKVMENREMIVDKYVNRMSYKELYDKHKYSKSQIFKIIASEIINQADL